MHDWLDWSVTALTATAIICRLLTPTEGAPLGDTLWIVQLTLLTLLLWSLAKYRAGAVLLRIDRIDFAVCLLVLGELLSGVLHRGSADQRALCNMVWEWCGLLGTWFLVRRIAARPIERRRLTWCLLSLAVALAGLGIWQHYFGLAETRQAVARLRSEWNQLHARGQPADPREALAWEREVQRLRAEFVQQRIPIEVNALSAWEQRLNSSTEPFGTFGLANTFAGLLCAALILWLSSLVEQVGGRTARSRLWGLGVAALVLAFCLLLTKSRTAYVGLVVGFLAGVFGRRRDRLSPRRAWAFGGLVAAVMAVLAGVATFTGALDKFVVGESFKSLRYRGEYWVGTWRMMCDELGRALTGVGPGNFRAYYLQYKLPESSEEIADPHNLFLDVWAGGGLVALAGLGGLLAAGLLPLVKVPPPVDAPLPLPEPGRRRSSGKARDRHWCEPVAVGACLAFLCSYGLGGTFDDRMFPLWGASIVVAALAHALSRIDLPPSAYAAGFVALAVHLLGAGGMSMPAITQTLFWLVAFGACDFRLTAWTWESSSRPVALALGAGALAINIGCALTAMTPTADVRGELAAAERALFDEGRVDNAERAGRRAVAADPLAAEPCEWLARLALQRWQQSGGKDAALFDESVYWQRQAILRNPRQYRAYRELGAAYLARRERTGDQADAALAADEFARAAELYPHHAALQSELAEALWHAGQLDAARSFAEHALELDEINRTAGHRDKLLDDARRSLLEEILQQVNKS